MFTAKSGPTAAETPATRAPAEWADRGHAVSAVPGGGDRPRAGKAPRAASESVRADEVEDRAILNFVDELARLAADLWFAGKLEGFDTNEEPFGADDD
jgi:hypothetical protein